MCSDISDDGVTFEAVADLDLTEIVELEFLPKDQPVFRRRARLLYRFGCRYGAHFSTSK